MDQKILDFLAKEKVSALSVCMPDGTCHNAAMHYSHIAEPLTIYIQTENTSKKMAGLKDGQPVAASVVVGFNEQEMKTLQMDGQIRISTRSVTPSILLPSSTNPTLPPYFWPSLPPGTVTLTIKLPLPLLSRVNQNLFISYRILLYLVIY